jgi:hypothetical protein
MPGACEVPELGHETRPGFLRSWFVFVVEAAENGPALDLLLGEAGDGVVGPGWAELAAAMGSSPVAVGPVTRLGPAAGVFAEDQHPVGHLRPGGEREPFGAGVRAGASGRDLPGLDAGAREDRVGGFGELPGPVARNGELGGICKRQPFLV